MTFTPPVFLSDAFNCPHCETYAFMSWSQQYVHKGNGLHACYTYEASCSKCKALSLWISKNGQNGQFIYPEKSITVQPAEDMPEDVKSEYIEAAKVITRSPRSAAALLRLGLQKLCKHLGEKGDHIDTDLRALAAKNILPSNVIKAADTMRLTGNNAVHPGEMDSQDIDQVAMKMFDLLNFIVKKAITEPKELDALYEKTPAQGRAIAESKDAKARNPSA